MKTLFFSAIGVIVGAGLAYWLTPIVWGMPWHPYQTMMLIVVCITLIPFFWWINRRG